MALLASNYSVEFVEALEGEDSPIIFKRVYGLNMRLRTARAVNQNGAIENIAGDIEPINITLERGAGKGLAALYHWFKKIRDGHMEKREILITLFNNAQQQDDPAVVWRVKRAFPVALHAPEWNTEEHELTFDDVQK